LKDICPAQQFYIRPAAGTTNQSAADKLWPPTMPFPFAGLGGFINMPLRTYSTGMQIRLAFSIATLAQPDILVMDEWLTVGDVDFQEKAQRRLSELIQNTSILVIASHAAELVSKLCNRVSPAESGCRCAACQKRRILSSRILGQRTGLY
jgi:ABC-type polysaccharide/polyol phosphate transport system ATPase subunit